MVLAGPSTCTRIWVPTGRVYEASGRELSPKLAESSRKLTELPGLPGDRLPSHNPAPPQQETKALRAGN